MSDELCFLLTDIVSSTALWEQDPLAMDAAVARHDEIIRSVVEGAGGRLVRHRGEGDSTFSIFGDPRDAIVAAADLLQLLACERWPGGVTIQIRGGLHAGEVIERDGEWYGPTVNRAARLRGLAQPGEVLVSTVISDSVRGRLPNGIALIDRGSRALRGAARPEWTRALVDERAPTTTAVPPSRRTTPLPVGLSPRPDELQLVGRNDVLARLRSRWTEARAGRRRIALLAGDAGIGKSRLARHLAQEVHAEGATVLHVECDVAEGHTLVPVARSVAAVLGAFAPMDARVLAGEGAPLLARLGPDVAGRLGMDQPGGAPDAAATLDAVSDLVGSLAATTPVLVVVDDLHLAGEPVAGLVRRLHDGGDRFPALVTVTYRTSDIGGPVAALVHDLTRGEGVELIRLAGLDLESTLHLLTGFVARGERAARAAGVLRSATAGNPFLVTAVLRNLAAGALDDVEDPEDLVLPESVGDVVTARLATLGTRYAEVLRVAAVLGREIDLEVVAEVTGASARELAEAEDAWERAALVVRDASGRLAFGHALLRQGIAEQVAPLRRKRLQRRAAEVLDGWGRSAEAAPHWRAAADSGDGPRVAAAACSAATAALARTDLDEARRWVAAALRALDEHGGEEHPLRATLHLIDAEAALPVSVDEALEAADAAISSARAAGDATTLARAALVRCNGYTVVLNGEDPIGMALHEEALDRLGDAAPALRSRLLANIANHRARRDGLGIAATPIANESVALARAAGDDAALAYALRLWLQVRQGAPDPRERLPSADEMVAAAERAGDRWELMLSLQRRAGVRLEIGDRAGYERDVAEAERRAARIATPVARYEVLFRRVLRGVLDGRFDDARRHLGRLAELTATLPTVLDAWATQTLLLEREVGDLAGMVPVIEEASRANPGLVAYRVALAAAWALADRDAEAGALLTELCRDDCAALPRDSAWPSLLALLAEVAIGVGDRRLVRLLRRELDGHSGLLLLGYESICLGAADRFIAMLDAELGQPADDRFEAAAALELRAGAPALLARTRVWQGRARLAAGDPVGAVLVLDAARELTQALGTAVLATEATWWWGQARDDALTALARTVPEGP